MRYFIVFVLSLVFISCSPSQDEIQSQIDIAVNEAIEQTESDSQFFEETIQNLEEKIEEINEEISKTNKDKFFTWGTEYFKSIVDSYHHQQNQNFPHKRILIKKVLSIFSYLNNNPLK